MRHMILLLSLLLTGMLYGQQDFSKLSGTYYNREGQSVTFTHRDKDWEENPVNEITYTSHDFYYLMQYYSPLSEQLGLVTYKMLNMDIFIIEMEPGVFVQFLGMPDLSFNGGDYVQNVYAKDKPRVAKWTDKQANEALLEARNK